MEVIEDSIVRIEEMMNKNVNDNLKLFEEKIQKMSFDYTKNLDNTKSDYLKRYLENRMDCIQNEVSNIPKRISELRCGMESIDKRLEYFEEKNA